MNHKQLPTRTYASYIMKDLEKKMVFIGGPRQVGKTTLATSFLKNYSPGHPAYYNWDYEESRYALQKGQWNKGEPLIILDEIHKRKGWQRFVKGIWDVWKESQKFIITGSARLDIFRKGGDSMLGRYHHYRIHPFTLPELGNTAENLEILFKFGGFPEPLINQDERELRRWHLQRVARIVREDLRDLENVNDLDKVELLAQALIDRAAGTLSYKSLAEDLAVSDKTAQRWVGILDALYFCYLLPPFGSAKIKAIKKAKKTYLWDWSQVADPGARFENMVASHLTKLCDFWQDVDGYKSELRYLRDDNGREVDFVVFKDRKPQFAVEVKLSDQSLSPNIYHFRSKKLGIPKWYQVTLTGEKRRIEPDVVVLGFGDFCQEVGLV